MGETGCGKTRLVKFLCELMVPRDVKTFKPITQNMIIMKVFIKLYNYAICIK
jgi:energy-coupling factor transporter ATP-binding protein EcfA2